MKLLVLFTLGVLIGSAWCDEICFSKQFARCAQKNIEDISKVYGSCDGLKDQGKCVLSAALDCDTKFIPEAYKYSRALNYVCRKSDDYYEKFRPCFGNAVNGSNCQDPYKKIMEDKTTPKEILKGLKEVCNKADWFQRCLQGNTEDFCGGIKSDYFYDSVLERVVNLNEHLCREVIQPADDQLHELTILGIPRLVEVAVAILTVP